MPFELKAALGLDQSSYVAGFEQAKATARSFAKDLNTTVGGELAALKSQFAAAFTTAAIVAGAKNVLEYAGKINDLKTTTKLSAEELQELGFAAEQTSSNIESVADAIKKTRVAQLEAVQGNKSKQDDFSKFGVTLDDLKTKSGKDIFLQIAAAVQKSGDAQKDLNAFLSIMGKSADSLLPSMIQGFSDLTAKAREAGIVMSEGLISALDDMGDDVDAFFAKFKKGFGYLAVGAYGITGTGASLAAAPLKALYELLTGGGVKGANEAADSQIDRAADSLVRAFFNTGDSKLTSELEAKLAARRQLREAQRSVGDRNIDFTPPQKGKRSQENYLEDSLARIGGNGTAAADRNFQLGQAMLQTVKGIQQLLQQGNYGADQVTSLI